MKREWNFLAGILFSALVLASAISIFGQQKPGADRGVVVTSERVVQGPDGPQGPPPPGDNFVFVSSEMNFDGKLVKGAPYSAQAVTEMTQTLGDGNRIVNKSTASVYRDSEGRTRRELTLPAIGPFANEGEPLQTISINDPVAGVNYALDPRLKVAHKMSPMRFEFKMMPPGGGEAHPGTPPDGPPPPAGPPPEGLEHPQVFMRTVPGPHPPMGGAGVVMEWHGTREGTSKAESLGKQTIEGVEAEGSRTTVTIPAGEIGNEQAIQMVSERWYSPELQVVVMSRHSDPRSGEHIYRLTNIDRSEPAKSLFEVPADYTIADNQPSTLRAISRSKIISGGVLNAKAISLPNPEYPAVARQARASGTVTVQVTIDEDGGVVSARAISGHPLLQAAAVTAARQARFSPTKLSGQSVKVQGVVTYNFVVE